MGLPRQLREFSAWLWGGGSWGLRVALPGLASRGLVQLLLQAGGFAIEH